MVTPTALLYAAAGNPVVPSVRRFSGVCYLCGSEIREGVPFSVALKDSFTNHDVAARPDGTGFCRACSFSFQEQIVINGKQQQRIRNYSHLIAAGQWRAVTKSDKSTITEFLLTEHRGWWIACLADSGQKHLVFRCPVNYGSGGNIRVMLEERVIETTRERLAALVPPIQSLLDLGASKAAIERGNYGQKVLLKCDRLRLAESEAIIAPARGNGSFALALWLTQKKEDKVA